MAKVRKNRGREIEQMAQTEQMRAWAIQRGITPAERYRLGPTNTWHTDSDYYKKILPLWLEKTPMWGNESGMPVGSAYFALVYGGILDTNYVAMSNVWTGNRARIYVQDSAKTRDVLRYMQSIPLKPLAYRFVKTRLLQQTFEMGWLVLFRQVIALRRRLNSADWRENLDGQALNLHRHIKVGTLIDDGLLPPDLLVIALRLITVHMQDFLTTHSSGGYIEPINKGKPRRILVVYGHKQLVDHHKVRLCQFYRSNLYIASPKFRRVAREKTS